MLSIGPRAGVGIETSTYPVANACGRRGFETQRQASLISLILAHRLIRYRHTTRAFIVVARSSGANWDIGAGRGVKGDHRAGTLVRDFDVDMDTGETELSVLTDRRGWGRA